MIPALKVQIKERGAVPRKLRKVYTASSKVAWAETGRKFHAEMRDDRFTKEHARVARYVKRRGEEPGLSESDFRRSYTGKKLSKWGHTNPLQWSGETRRNVRSANISQTSKGATVRYPGARKLNFRNPHSSINMADEFRRTTADERKELAAQYDTSLNREMNADKTTEVRTI